MSFEKEELASEDLWYYRHACPKSEKFVGGDVLLTMLYRGWNLTNQFTVEEIWFGQARRQVIYHLRLFYSQEGQDRKIQRISVLSTPLVDRLIRKLEEKNLITSIRADDSF